MTIFGIDLSDYDWDRGPVDVAAMARDGISWVTHKATEGTRTKHRRYGEALNRARAAGIPVLGAYVVPRTPGNGGHGSVTAQVDYLLSHVDSQTPWWRTWPHWMWQVDLEHWGYDQVPPAVGVEMARQLRARTGKFVVLYAPRWAYGDSIGGDVPLWASNYGSNPVGSYRDLYPGDGSSRWAAYSGRTPIILQYGSKTRIGSQGTCDANAFRGDIAAFAAMIGAGGSAQIEGDDMANTWTQPLTQGTAGYAGQQRDTALAFAWQASNEAVAGVGKLLAAAAADEVRDKAMLAAIEALATGGGNPDAVPTVVAAINAVRDEARQQFAALADQHTAEMAARAQEHAAEVAGLRAELAALGG